MSDQRWRERIVIERPITVIDVLLNHEVGTIVNLHEEGFMVIGDGDVRENCLYQLALDGVCDQAFTLFIGAECLWKKETESGLQYWAGFHIVDISDKDREKITQIIAES